MSIHVAAPERATGTQPRLRGTARSAPRARRERERSGLDLQDGEALAVAPDDLDPVAVLGPVAAVADDPARALRRAARHEEIAEIARDVIAGELLPRVVRADCDVVASRPAGSATVPRTPPPGRRRCRSRRRSRGPRRRARCSPPHRHRALATPVGSSTSDGDHSGRHEEDHADANRAVRPLGPPRRRAHAACLHDGPEERGHLLDARAPGEPVLVSSSRARPTAGRRWRTASAARRARL